uniref:Prolamin n=1 Tax=Zea mays TaxID=4577 RepID=B6SI60_MAIZE|nr:prolamin [Zea mays]
MAAKMFALFALLALCATATSATHIPGHLSPLLMPLATMNPWMQYCMKQQGVANLLAWPTLMLQQLLASPLQPCQMPMMMPGMMPPMTMMPMPNMMPSMMVPTMMSPIMMMPSMMPSTMTPSMMPPIMMPSMIPPMMMPSMVSSMIMPNMMTVPQCYSDSISHIIQQQQLPFMFSPTAVAISPMFLQQPFVGAAF